MLHTNYNLIYKNGQVNAEGQVTYTNLLTSGRLNAYLADIDKQAQKRFEGLKKYICSNYYL